MFTPQAFQCPKAALNFEECKGSARAMRDSSGTLRLSPTKNAAIAAAACAVAPPKGSSMSFATASALRVSCSKPRKSPLRTCHLKSPWKRIISCMGASPRPSATSSARKRAPRALARFPFVSITASARQACNSASRRVPLCVASRNWLARQLQFAHSGRRFIWKKRLADAAVSRTPKSVSPWSEKHQSSAARRL